MRAGFAMQTFTSLAGLKLDRFHHATKTNYQTAPERLANLFDPASTEASLSEQQRRMFAGTRFASSR